MKTNGFTAKVIINLTDEEKQNHFNKFGESFWNDAENICCIPIRYFEDQDKFLILCQLYGYTIKDYDYLIIHFDPIREDFISDFRY